jgi:hypothetical protein
MALVPNQQKVTTKKAQENAIIERVHKVFNKILISSDFENNHIMKI